MPADIDEKLRSEILNMLLYVQRLREEIAGVVGRRDGQTAFESMSDQLDAIVAATGEATETILEGIEPISEAVAELRGEPGPEKLEEICDRITANATQALEACSFQDISGQRVSKIVRSLRFIEERVDALAGICGREEIEALGTDPPAEEHARDGIVLEGPQLPGKAISQQEIDKLFE